ncbi:MAG: hypothetical protein ACOX3C_05940 [Bacilli bacterium]
MAYDVTSFIGDRRKTNMAWAYDALVLGQSELSEAMVRKMGGWAAHRLGFASALPEGHPCKTRRPVLDAEDLPCRYVHDNDAWTEWGQSTKDKTLTRVNAGGPRVEPRGFERVFYDDFRANRISLSTSGGGDLWMAPRLQHGRRRRCGADEPRPRAERLSPRPREKAATPLAGGKQSGNRWRGSAFYSVNDVGQGYTWAGPKVFRIRCMFPKATQEDLGGGPLPRVLVLRHGVHLLAHVEPDRDRLVRVRRQRGALVQRPVLALPPTRTSKTTSSSRTRATSATRSMAAT